MRSTLDCKTNARLYCYGKLNHATLADDDIVTFPFKLDGHRIEQEHKHKSYWHCEHHSLTYIFCATQIHRLTFNNLHLLNDGILVFSKENFRALFSGEKIHNLATSRVSDGEKIHNLATSRVSDGEKIHNLATSRVSDGEKIHNLATSRVLDGLKIATVQGVVGGKRS